MSVVSQSALYNLNSLHSRNFLPASPNTQTVRPDTEEEVQIIAEKRVRISEKSMVNKIHKTRNS